MTAQSTLRSLLYSQPTSDYVWQAQASYRELANDTLGALALDLCIKRLWQQYHRDYPQGVPVSQREFIEFLGFKNTRQFLDARDKLVNGGWITITYDKTRSQKALYRPAWGKQRNGTIPVWTTPKDGYGRKIGNTPIRTYRVPNATIDIAIGRFTPHYNPNQSCIERYTTNPINARELSVYLRNFFLDPAQSLDPDLYPKLKLAGLINAAGIVQPTDHVSGLDALVEAEIISERGQRRRIDLHLDQPRPHDQSATTLNSTFFWYFSLILMIWQQMIALVAPRSSVNSPLQKAKSIFAHVPQFARSMPQIQSNHEILLAMQSCSGDNLTEDEISQKGKHHAIPNDPNDLQNPQHQNIGDSEKNHITTQLRSFGVYPVLARRFAANIPADVIHEVIAALDHQGERIRKPGGWLVRVLQDVMDRGIDQVRQDWQDTASELKSPDFSSDAAPFDVAKYTTGKYATFFNRDHQPSASAPRMSSSAMDTFTDLLCQQLQTDLATKGYAMTISGITMAAETRHIVVAVHPLSDLAQQALDAAIGQYLPMYQVQYVTDTLADTTVTQCESCAEDHRSGQPETPETIDDWTRLLQAELNHALDDPRIQVLAKHGHFVQIAVPSAAIKHRLEQYRSRLLHILRAEIIHYVIRS